MAEPQEVVTVLSKLFRRKPAEGTPYVTHICPHGHMWLIPLDPEKHLQEVLTFQGSNSFTARIHQHLRDLQSLPCGCELPNTTEIE